MKNKRQTWRVKRKLTLLMLHTAVYFDAGEPIPARSHRAQRRCKAAANTRAAAPLVKRDGERLLSNASTYRDKSLRDLNCSFGNKSAIKIFIECNFRGLFCDMLSKTLCDCNGSPTVLAMRTDFRYKVVGK